MFSVLICDDSMVARKQVAKCLPRDWEVAIHFAKHGKEAITAIEEGKGQLMFLDLNMPIMDGYETLKMLQKNQLNSQVIVISGDVQPTAHERVKALGAIEFIEKPVNPEQIHAVLVKHQFIAKEQIEAQILASSLPADIRDCYQEITNIAMGQAGDHLARMLNVFVKLPIPNVNLIEVSELHMMLQDIEDKDSVSGICQGFLGAGVSGEALFILSDSSFGDVAKIMNVTEEIDDQVQLELLMDAANILIGTCLRGFANQLDLNFSQGHPIVLGQHRSVSELISHNKAKWRRTLAIELSYGLEGYNVQCDLVLLFTEESMQVMNYKLSHLLED
ncbi:MULTISPECIES: response regulator [Aliiglaciecola]|uniref:response regulator n=1 Tax=Aliiglaciecola TaxID=1406885 RepID=UPI001C0893FC|nr:MULTISPECIES: response regulator [Aliiglaciecola]MBU2877723.1 response regulator [Aliiglaciecola lipolytica]MDO6713304.1 response regulator [Aliiglaciecola sp. 2_MG-2023]MDO6754451.1 response regulator [Aliiglaciecola sp. 1_MG-2023]